MGALSSTDPCPNCGAPGVDRFCPSCGQDNRRARLELKPVLGETLETLVGWESALVATLRGLVVDPGGMVKDYVEGRRRRYVNPARFCLLSLALWFLVMKGFDLDALRDMGFKITSTGAEPGSERMLFAEDLRRFLGSNLQVLLYVTLPLEALLLRVAFRRSGRNLAENLALVLYLAGFSYLLGLVAAPFQALGLELARPVRVLISFVWLVRAVRGFHGAGWVSAILRSLLVSFGHVVGTVIVFILVGIPVVALRRS